MKVAQSCPTLCDPMDQTVYGILQDRILEWVAIPFSRGSSQSRDWTQVFNKYLLHKEENEWKEEDVKFCGSEELGDDIAAECHFQGPKWP